MKRLMIAVLLLTAVPALADRDHGHGHDDWDRREVPEHAVAVSEEDLLRELNELQQKIDRLEDEDRERKRDRIADNARDQLKKLRQMVKDAPRIDRQRWRDRYLMDDRGTTPVVVVQQPPQTLPANYNPPPPPGQGTYQQQPVVYPIAQPALNQLNNAIRHESFPRDRLRILGSAAPNHYFTVDQAQMILGNFNFSTDRLQALRILKPRLLDRENFYKLYSSFEFANDKAQLKQILEQ